jgi:hypothetical protein
LNDDAEIDLGDALERLREAVAARGDDIREADYATHEASEPEADPLDVAAALAVIPNADLEWDEWNRIGMATWRATGGSASGLAAFISWSEKSGKYHEADVRERWQHYFTSPPTHIGAGTLFVPWRQAWPGWRKPTDFVAPPSGDPFMDYANRNRPAAAGQTKKRKISTRATAPSRTQPHTAHKRGSTGTCRAGSIARSVQYHQLWNARSHDRSRQNQCRHSDGFRHGDRKTVPELEESSVRPHPFYRRRNVQAPVASPHS